MYDFLKIFTVRDNVIIDRNCALFTIVKHFDARIYVYLNSMLSFPDSTIVDKQSILSVLTYVVTSSFAILAVSMEIGSNREAENNTNALDDTCKLISRRIF